ncbi:helix-turn-helix transcriptional regulator [Methylibium rhizosphaerae]|uniref:helix-turn-helix transcriptional regulator n=1 Tax=Methylibium rhizosphaerae TaxID=2570323 RepID=UPI001129B9DA|nr:LuxR family transcriptional regulator [Methylibium rhizosphaerae]
MPEAMSSDRFTVMLGVSSVEGFREELLRFTRWLGFEFVAAIVVIDRPMSEPDFLAVDNAPDAYREMADDREAARFDPVMQHCRHHGTPAIWGRGTYAKRGLLQTWEEQAAHGYCAGICVAQHLPQGRHFVVGVDRDQPLPASLMEQQRMAADLCLFTAYAQQSALQLFGAREVVGSPARLSPRELEVLRWTMAGKTAWEVGAILGISEQTVVRHLGHAAQKLGCVNKVQAVARALQLGLIA